MKFFISRAGEDREWGVWIADILKVAGHETFLQEDDIQFGNDFVERMKAGLDWCDHVIAILSPDYLRKHDTTAELHTGYLIDKTGDNRALLLIRVRDCEIPRLFARYVYVDVRERNEPAKRILLARIEGKRPIQKFTHRTFISKLPTVDPTLIGREEEIAFLDESWSDPATNFVQIIAWGGTGKTALVDKWFRRHIEEATVFGWSFYSQGTGDNRQTSSDPFFAEVFRFFNMTVEPTASIYAKAEALARHMREQPVLLILDGIEPLQDATGTLRDPPLKALLQELATRNKGLVVCTTRVRITDIPDDEPRTRSKDLNNLHPIHGAEYLSNLGVQGTNKELRKASNDYGNHALALTLLGTYLVDFCNADVRRRVEIPKLMIDEVKQGAHARRVMEAYARMFEGEPELDILRALGYFDRPAEPAALNLVMPLLPDLKYRAALNRLRVARLIHTGDPSASIDCHPLIREHFADVTRSTKPDAFHEGHSRLFDYYKEQGPYQPDTLEEMMPLFYAVYHGCQSGRHVETRREVYRDRILRGNDCYILTKLGAFGTNLALVSNFFESRWTQPVALLSPVDRSWIMSFAALTLQGLGHLADAVEPMRATAEAVAAREDWRNAAVDYSNLSLLYLTLGNIREATIAARQSVDFADRSGEPYRQMSRRTILAAAFHQAGAMSDAKRFFEEAERLQTEWQPHFPIISSLWGYAYCDLLLTQDRKAEVLRRATQTLQAFQSRYSLLDIGLDHLSLGRAHPEGSPDSATHLNQAVHYLRRAGTMNYLPLALLARGTPQDLEEAYTIASRSGMRLYLADYHLAMARLHNSREHLEKAEALINETGYHRRDPELTELRQILRNEP